MWSIYMFLSVNWSQVSQAQEIEAVDIPEWLKNDRLLQLKRVLLC